MILGPDWVFVSVPKCATHSLYELLTARYGGIQNEGAYHQNMIPREHRDKPVFTCVRSPWTRTVSAWGRMVHPEREEEPMPFPAFVSWLIDSPHPGKPVYQPMSTWLSPVLDRVHAWRLESLDRDMAESGFSRHGTVPRLWTARERGIGRDATDITPWADVPSPIVSLWKEWAAEDFERWY